MRLGHLRLDDVAQAKRELGRLAPLTLALGQLAAALTALCCHLARERRRRAQVWKFQVLWVDAVYLPRVTIGQGGCKAGGVPWSST